MKVELTKEQSDALARALVAHGVLVRMQPRELEAPPWGYEQAAKDVQTLRDVQAVVTSYRGDD